MYIFFSFAEYFEDGLGLWHNKIVANRKLTSIYIVPVSNNQYRIV